MALFAWYRTSRPRRPRLDRTVLGGRCRPHPRGVRPFLEFLEPRTVPSGQPAAAGADFDALTANAQVLPLTAADSASQPGSIDAANPMTVYQFVPATSGSLAIREQAAGSDLNPALSVYDSAGGVLATRADTLATGQSQVAVGVQAGQTYYVQVAGAAGSTGAYLLTVTPYADDFGNTPNTAQLLTLAADDSGTQPGTIEVSGDVDVFRFTASHTGGLSIQEQAAPGSGLDTSLMVLDNTDKLLASQDDTLQLGESQVALDVVKGQVYYVEAAGHLTSVGAYQLNFTPYSEDFGSTLATAAPLTLTATGAGSQTGVIEVPGDKNVFQFVPSISGSLAIREQANASALNPSLTVFNATGQTLASQDDTAQLGKVQVAVEVQQGQTYYVQAAGHAASTGAYQVTLTPYQADYGNDLAHAYPLTLAADGTATLPGTIEVPGDVNDFQFTTPVSGGLSISETAPAGSGLSPLLTVFDSTGQQVAQHADTIGTGQSLVALHVAAGETYYLQAAGQGWSTGAYQLAVAPFTDDFPNTEATAAPLTVAAGGTATQPGAIEVPGDVDVFQFTAATSGPLVIQEAQVAGSALNPVVTVYDGLGQAHAGTTGGTTSEAALHVVAGETYYIQAAGYSSFSGSPIGAYVVSLAPYSDDFGNDEASAYPLTLSAQQTASQAGMIEVPGDVDAFQFTPATSGPLVIQQAPAAGSSLVCALTVSDGSGNTYSGVLVGSSASQVALHVLAGQTYYVTAASSSSRYLGGQAVGAYVVTIAPYTDDFGNTPAEAQPLSLSATDTATQAGAIEVADDVDVFRVVASSATPLLLTEQAAVGSHLGPSLSVIDGLGNTYTAPFGGTSSQVALHPVPGQTYYVSAGGTRYGLEGTFPTGAYVLSIAPYSDDFGNTPASATPLTVAADGSATQQGSIDVPPDVDTFSYTATTSGAVVIRQDPITGSPLVANLSVSDSAGRTYSSVAVGTSSQVALHTVAGQTYYITAASVTWPATGAVGTYVLTVAPYDDDFGNTLADASPLSLSAAGLVSQTGTIEVAGDVDVFRFTPAVSEPLAIREDPAPDSALTASLTVYDSVGDPIYGTPVGNSSVTALHVMAGQTYYVQAAGISSYNGTATGGYVVGIVPYTDDYGNDPADAFPLTLAADGTATQTGNIEVAGDVDVFQFTATTAGPVVINLAPADGSTLNTTLNVTDSAGNSYATTYLGANAANGQVALHTIAGQSYYVEASGYAGIAGTTPTGAYVLTVAPYTDDYGNDDADAYPLTIAPDGSATQNGTIEVAADVDVFQFTATTAGPVVINLAPADGSTLNATLNVTDSAGNSYTTIYLGANDTTGQVALHTIAGQTYYLEASGYAGTNGTTPTGAYVLTVAPYADDYGNDNADAYPLTFAADGSATQDGTIEVPADLDVFQFTATTAGPVVINLAPADGSTLNSTLNVTDSAGNGYSTTYLGANAANGQVALHTVAGLTYYLQVGGFDGTSGAYVLTVAPYPDDYGNDQAHAYPLTPAADGTVTQTGTIEVPADVDFFQFTAPTAEAVVIGLAPADGSTLNTTLNVTDSAGNSYATSYGGANSATGQVALHTIAGQTYYFEAGGFSGTSGAYVLTVTPYTDDYGDDPAHAYPLTPAADGTSTQTGSIEVPGDVDVFQYTATTAGAIYINLAPAAGSTLNSVLSVTDNVGNSYPTTYLGPNAATGQVALHTVVGRTYYFQASGYSGIAGTTPTGAYVLTVAPYTDDYGNDQADAYPLTLAADGSAIQTGTIEIPADVDVFQYTAATSGSVLIRLAPAAGSSLVTSLSVTDSEGNPYNAVPDGLSSDVALQTVAGQTYYLTAAASLFGSTDTLTGAYVLTVTPYTDDYGNDQADAYTLTLAADGSATQPGTIEVTGDVDYFQFTPSTSGAVAIREDPAANSTLAAALTVYDSTDDAFYGVSLGNSSVVTLDVVAGQTYYVEAAGSSYPPPAATATGAYVVSITPYADDFGNDQVDAYALTVAADGSVTQTGTIEVPGDVDVFQYTAAVSGSFLFNLAPADGSALVTLLSVTDSEGNPYYAVTDGSSSDVALQTVAGQTYYLTAAASNDGSTDTYTGAYVLTVTPYTDDYGNDQADAYALTPAADGSVTQTGTIEVPGDVDVFQYTATTAGSFLFSLSPAAGSMLAAALSITDSAGDAYYPVAVGNSSELGLQTVAGQTYYLTASASDYGAADTLTGAYVLAVAPYTDDYGNDPAHAYPLSLAADGTATQAGTIEVPGDVDVFQFTAATSGPVLVSLAPATSSSLAAALSVTDSAGNFFYGVSTGTSSQIHLHAVAGRTYYVTAAGNNYALSGAPTGTYVLNIGTYVDDYGDDEADAFPLTVAADGSAAQPGIINYQGDVDFFQFTAATTSEVTVQVAATGGGSLVPSLGLFDATGFPLAGDISSQGTVTLHVTQGDTYYAEVSAGASGDQTGSYLLTLQPFVDDVGNTEATARVVPLNADNSGSTAASLQVSSDVEIFAFVAQQSGALAVRVSPASGSSLDAALTVQDSSGTTYDGVSAGTNSSQAALHVVAGQTYYATVSSSPGSNTTGRYVVTFTSYTGNDNGTGMDAGNSAADAMPITLAADGTGTVTGSIDVAGDLDVYQFTAPVTGQMSVAQDSASGGTLSSSLLAFDSAGDLYYGTGANASISQVSFPVVQGQTYYVEATGGVDGSTGGYQLTFTPTVDAFGHTLATAHSIPLSATNTATQDAAIVSAGEVDYFTIVPQQSGAIVVEQDAAPGSSVNSRLTILDQFGDPIAYGISIGALRSQAALHVLAGQTYYIEAGGGFSGSTGAYVLSIASYADDYGNDPSSAHPVTLTAEGNGTQTGSIEVPADVDFFSVQAPLTGELAVQLGASLGSALSGTVTVFDALGHPTYGTSTGAHSSQASLHVDAGQTYYVEVSGSYSGSTGDYQLTFTSVLDDYGNTLAQAYPITLSASDTGSQTGTIETAGDVDMFRFTAPLSGPVVIRQNAAPGSSLASLLTVYNGLGQQVATDDGTGGSRNSQVALHLVAGQTYYVAAAGNGTSTGGYIVTFATYTDDFGNTFADAQPETLAADDSGSWTGTIEVAGDVDMFRFTSLVTGALAVRQEAVAGSALDSDVTVFDAQANPLAANENDGLSLNGRAAFQVIAGQTYYIQAGAAGGTTGGYRITLSPYVAAFGDDFASASPLTLAATGTTVQAGSIDLAGQVAMFQFTAPASGTLVIRQQATPGSALDSSLTVFDAHQHEIAYNDNSTVFDGSQDATVLTTAVVNLYNNTLLYLDSHLGTLNSQVALNVTAGQTYYVQAAGASASTGSYDLLFAMAQPFAPLAADGSAQQAGTITVPGDVNIYQFTAPTTETLQIVQSAASGRTLDNLLTVFDAASQELAFNDSTNAAGDCAVGIAVQAGHTYFIQAAGFGVSTGAYVLRVTPYRNAVGNTLGTASSLTLSAAGDGGQQGSITVAGDVDLFRITAPFTGQLSVDQAPTANSTLDPTLAVYSATGQSLATANDNGVSASADTVFSVQAGQTYYVQAGGFDACRGGYELTFAPYHDDYGNSLATATVVPLSPAGNAVLAGTIGVPTALDVFQFTAPVSGRMVLRQAPAPGSDLAGTLTVFNASGQQLAQDDHQQDIDSNQVTLLVNAGQTYYVQVAGDGTTQGGYELAFATPQPLTLGIVGPGLPGNPSVNAGSAAGSIDAAGGIQLYAFTARATGSLVIHQAAASGSALDSTLSILDASGRLLAQNDDSGGTLNSQVALAVVAGTVYYVEAQGHGASTGAFALTFAPYQDDVGNSLATAQAVALPASGPVTQVTGTIEVVGDVDDYRFVAPVSGEITIQQNAAAGSTLDSFLTVFDATGTVLAQNDDSNGSINSQVSFHIDQGQTYYVQAAASDLAFSANATGRYDLVFDLNGTLPERIPNAATVPQVLLDSSGYGTVKLALTEPGEVGTFAFTAPVTGLMTLQGLQTAGGSTAPGAPADTVAVSLFDASGNLVASDSQAGGPQQVRFKMAAGQQYFVQVQDMSHGIGNFSFVLGVDLGNTAATAPPVSVSGVGSQVGAIDAPGGSGFLRFVASANEQLQIRLNTPSGENLTASVQVLNADEEPLTDAGQFLTIAVSGGQTYLIETTGAGTTIGRYDLVLDTSGLLVPGPVASPSTVSGVPLPGLPVASTPGEEPSFSVQGPGTSVEEERTSGGGQGTIAEAGTQLGLLLPGTAPLSEAVTGAVQAQLGEFVPVSAGASVALVANLFLVNGGEAPAEPDGVVVAPPTDVAIPESTRLLRFYLGADESVPVPPPDRGETGPPAQFPAPPPAEDPLDQALPPDMSAAPRLPARVVPDVPVAAGTIAPCWDRAVSAAVLESALEAQGLASAWREQGTSSTDRAFALLAEPPGGEPAEKLALFGLAAGVCWLPLARELGPPLLDREGPGRRAKPCRGL